jgi:uncharacterized DUF497 family protein
MISWDESKRARNLKDHGIDFAGLEGFFDGDISHLISARKAENHEYKTWQSRYQKR